MTEDQRTRIVNGGRLTLVVTLTMFLGWYLGRPSAPVIQPAPPVAFAPRKPADPTLGVTAPVQVLRVIDGDTVVCEVRLTFHARLLDCWAPELHDATGPASKAALVKLCEGKAGVFAWNGETTLGRYLGKLYVDGRDMSAEQVKAGQAASAKGLPVGK